MKSQYRIYKITTGETLGWLLGKSANPNQKELVYQVGNQIKTLKITPRTEQIYKIEKLKVGVK